MKRHLLVPAILTLFLVPAMWWGLPMLNKPQIGGNFQLTSKAGPWKLSQSKGKITILYFGFTRCPDVCPITLHKLNKMLKSMEPAQAQKIQVVFISVDHKSDNPAQVDEYSKNIHPSFIGLTGSKQEIDDVVRLYKTTYMFQKMQGSEFNYTVVHSNRVYVLNKKGEYITSLIIEDEKTIKDIIQEYI